MTARLGSVYTLLLLLPGLVSLNFTWKKLQDYTTSYESINTNGSKTVCIGSYNCKTYSKEFFTSEKIPENLSGIYNNLRLEYENNLKLAVLAKQNQLKYLYEAIIFSSLFIIPVIFLYFFNRITLKQDILILHTLIPAVVSISPVPHVYRWKSSFVTKIPLSKILSISVVTKTPLIEKRSNLLQINWRDEIFIQYLNEKEDKDFVKVSLFLFPKFKQILIKITNKLSDIPISFGKTTMTENLREIEFPLVPKK